MISVAEIRYSVAGALRLARADADGLAHFDHTIERYWRSFWAAAICAPMYVAIMVFLQQSTPPKDWTRFVAILVVDYAIAWSLWALAMVYLADWMQRGHLYFRYFQVYNWAQVVGTTLGFVVLLLAQGMNTASLVALLWFVTLAVLVYEWYLTRLALEVSGLQAAGVVAFNLVLNYTINYASAAVTRL